MKVNKKNIIILTVLLILIVLLFLFLLFFKKQDTKIPTSEINTTSEDEENHNIVNDYTFEEQLPPSEIKYPEDIHFWEESLTGGGVPPTYTDELGNEYTRECFPSLGFAMYIPDGWIEREHSTDYIQNIFYLTTDKEGYDEIQLSVAVKTNIEGLSPSEIRDLFATDKNNLEYYFCNGKYKFITSMTRSWEMHQISTDEIPGFEDIDAQVLLYYDEPKTRFVLEIDPTYNFEPYVINYYIIKENTAIMLTGIGPYLDANKILSLMGSMGLNCRELVNAPPNGIHYSADEKITNGNCSFKIPSEMGKMTCVSRDNMSITSYKYSENRNNYLYNTEILFSNAISKEKYESIEDIFKDNKLTSLIVYTSLNGTNNHSMQVLDNLDYSFKYNPQSITNISLSGKIATKIPVEITIDETSLSHLLSLIQNPMKCNLYVVEDNGFYYLFIFRGTKAAESYMDNFAYSCLQTISFK